MFTIDSYLMIRRLAKLMQSMIKDKGTLFLLSVTLNVHPEILVPLA